MAVIIHKDTGIFHLCSSQVSYLIMVLPDGEIGQLYFGRRIHDREGFADLLELGHRDMAPCVFDRQGTDGRVSWGSTTFSREHIRQEYPSYGTGDMRQGAFEILQENGSTLSHFTYKGYRVFDGKEKLPGLPAVYVEDESEAQTLVIELEDTVTKIGLELHYTIYEKLPVIARHQVFVNHSGRSVILRRAMSLSLDLPDASYDMITLTGASLRERYPDRHSLHAGIRSIGSMRGHSSHQFNPFLALARPDAGEEKGDVIGISLVYSGSFLAQAEVDTMHVTRIMIGIHPQNFSWTLPGAGEGTEEKERTFCTPEALLVYSDQGLGGMSRTFHTLLRTRLARGSWRDLDRPIVVNNWEATYMDFDEAKILEIASKAKELGAEMFVLDDGWFGHREDDTSSLGDWYPNLRKLPGGIAGLSEKIEEMGLRFGLWIEPEMVSPDSELYRAHPDWVLGSEERSLCLGRHQLVLDLSKQEVVDHLYDTLEKLIAGAEISYIKWDMNRSLSDVYSRGNDAGYQGEVFHRQILGVYSLYERLISRFPGILFESCASGGGRFDPGMLYYAPQAWTSDCTDAAERVRIQYGTSMVYPLSCISAHVSAVPNHRTHRSVPLFTRGAVALFGAFGFELDVTQMTQEECRQAEALTGFVRKWRTLVREGQLYRLSDPFAGNEAGWMIISDDRRRGLVFTFRDRQPVNAGYLRMKLAGLDRDLMYSVCEADHETWEWEEAEGAAGKHYGDELMEIGLNLSDAACGVRTSKTEQGDAQARIFLVTAQQETN